VTNLSDLLLDEEDDDVKTLLINTQSDTVSPQQTTNGMNRASSSKRTRRLSKAVLGNDRNAEFVFDEEHLMELLKRLKQQSPTTTIDDESNLFDTLTSEYSYEKINQQTIVFSLSLFRTLSSLSRSDS
jgi:hypothetical protein